MAKKENDWKERLNIVYSTNPDFNYQTEDDFQEEELLAEDIEKLIEERQAARKAKNFARADEIRNELLEKGIILEDTREGVKWRKA
mgnify:CR=1 FL=1